MKIVSKDTEIHNIDDWFALAAPKGKERQWKEGKSAMETACAWIGNGKPTVPPDIRRVLDSADLSAKLKIDTVYPELVIPFDSYSGGTRNSDIAFVGTNPIGRVAVTVESKAGEPPGELIRKQAEIAAGKSEASNLETRLFQLLRGILKVAPDQLESVAHLRYQMLTAAAGTLTFAKNNGADLAVMLVHEFRTSVTKEADFERNEKDYHAFLEYLHRRHKNAGKAGNLNGPFHLPGGDKYTDPVPLYIGKVVTEVK